VPHFKEAIAWYEAGYMPLPLKIDGSKAPAVTTWTAYQHERPPLDEVLKLFRVDSDGLGLLCGAVSGGLEMLELEGRANDDGYAAKMEDAFRDHDLSELFNKITSGYVEATPSGGIHWYYRVDGPPKRNAKLARRLATEEELVENPHEKYKVLIETRAEGGFTVIAPSNGRSHPTGQSWWAIGGSPDTIPIITADERDTVHVICNTLDQMPLVQPPARGGLQAVSGTELRPGDDFNAKESWENILVDWTVRRHYGKNLYGWARPGKRGPGISATTGRSAEDRLFVFSTNTPFEPERPYSKFSAYATLEHGGDYSAAAKALRLRGFGGDSGVGIGGSSGQHPVGSDEHVGHLLQKVATIDPWFAEAQLRFAVQQAREHYSDAPKIWDGLRIAARRRGIPDDKIEEILGA
jgi:putative DNA primase/helicase